MTDPRMQELERSFKRRQLIEASGIRKVWTPHEPISSVELFWGRLGEIDNIVDAIETPGQHAILYGDRGVGKSSLANMAALVLEMHGHTSLKLRCDSRTTFATIASAVLRFLRVELDRPEVVQTIATQASGKIGAPFIGAATAADRSRSERRAGSRMELTPSSIARAVETASLFVVIDELDLVSSREDRRMVAELMKQLSDAHSKVKLLVVGIASSTADLLAGHPSVHRHLKEVHLGRMTNAEVLKLILGNAEKTKLTFAPPVVSEIVQLSDGFPYFAQLLGLKCAELAVLHERPVASVTSNVRRALHARPELRTVFPTDLTRALRLAAQDAEETLRSKHAAAIRSPETNLYAWIIQAAASVDKVEIPASELRAGVSTLAGRLVRQSELNNAFARLVGPDDSRILSRVSKGVYRFTDPRMKVYARLVSRIGAS